MKRQGVYYAHSGEGGRFQTAMAHSMNVARMAYIFGNEIGIGRQVSAVARLHDLGKWTSGFQARLDGGSAVDHSSIGAAMAATLMGSEETDSFSFGPVWVGCHHSWLPDWGNQYDPPEADTWCGHAKRIENKIRNGAVEIPAIPKTLRGKMVSIRPIKGISTDTPLAASFLMRYGYSCITDADFLDTEEFMHIADINRGHYDSLETLLDRLNQKLASFAKPKTPIARYRNSILNQCIKNSGGRKGLYTLTVPTGGGKTLSSMAFALRHAVKHGMKRVIYVCPYTSIIDQNAQVFADIFDTDGAKNVLEHHSGTGYKSDFFHPEHSDPRALAAENWDMPVVVTTTVQFFESLYSNRISRCRKLHNMANSVIIIDETQLIPFEQLRPCMAAISALVNLYGCTVVLCTATQPYLKELIEEFSNELGKNLQVHEICKTYRKYYDKFKRCQYRNMGMIKAADVIDEMCKARQVLCVVNNRALAQKIFNELPIDGRFHLSTSMTPKHRKRKIKQIREALAEGKTVRLVSTSLIEAGVDLDFPTVMRQQAGLDSILQAGGRCNREGLRDQKDCAVFVFDIYQGQDRKDPLKRTQMENDAILTGNIIREFKPTKLDSLEAIHEYFYRRMYAASACQMDKDGIVAMLRDGYEGRALPFETVARKFSLIDDEKTVTVYVPEDERGAVLLRRLIKGERTRNLFRELGQYGVTVYRNQLKKLLDAGLCECTDKEDTPDEEKEYLYYMTNTDIYSDDCGLPM